MAPVITQLPIELLNLGEAPHWHSEENALYLVGMYDFSIHKYEPDTGKVVKAKLEQEPHFILPIEGKKNHFLISQGRKVVEIEWSGDENPAKIVRTVTEVDHEYPTNVLNDGKADPRGSLVTGTYGENPSPDSPKIGSLYRIDPDGTTTKLASDVHCSNGLCWDVKEKAFYFIDTFLNNIQRFDYDLETGNISNPTVAFSVKELGLMGLPDGMTIDSDGNLWVAIMGSSKILKIDPRKSTLLETLTMPVGQVTSATFGGPNLDILYVTSASLSFGSKPDPPAGATYAVTGLNAKGNPNQKFRMS